MPHLIEFPARAESNPVVVASSRKSDGMAVANRRRDHAPTPFNP
jgi:hypothetical protein